MESKLKIFVHENGAENCPQNGIYIYIRLMNIIQEMLNQWLCFNKRDLLARCLSLLNA